MEPFPKASRHQSEENAGQITAHTLRIEKETEVAFSDSQKTAKP